MTLASAVADPADVPVTETEPAEPAVPTVVARIDL